MEWSYISYSDDINGSQFDLIMFQNIEMASDVIYILCHSTRSSEIEKKFIMIGRWLVVNH